MTEAQAVIAKSITEKQLSDNIVNLARMLGWLVHRDPTWRATGADPGYPDLTLLRKGELIFAELKKSETGGRVTDDQRRWLEALAALHNRSLRESPSLPMVQCYLWTTAQWVDGTIEETLR